MVPLKIYILKLVCILGRGVASFHGICESLPGIVTSYECNMLNTKVCHNLRLNVANGNKNIREIDWTMVIACGE